MSQNFVNFQKFQLENLVDFEKCCKTHIFLQKSEPIQPKTSNILRKFCRSATACHSIKLALCRITEQEAHITDLTSAIEEATALSAKLNTEIKNLEHEVAKNGSFSAVSTPIFARKYAFCSIFQNLPDYLAENFEIWQILRHLQNFC